MLDQQIVLDGFGLPILPPLRSNSSNSALFSRPSLYSITTSFAKMPCFREFILAAFFPAGVFGPVDFPAFLRFARICLSNVDHSSSPLHLVLDLAAMRFLRAFDQPPFPWELLGPVLRP